MKEKEPAKSPAITSKIRVMVIGLSGEKFAFDLARKGFDVMIVKNIFDAFRERHGSIVYKRNPDGVYSPLSIAPADLNEDQIKALTDNRAERRYLLRNLSKHLLN
jgi:hypothetical protein